MFDHAGHRLGDPEPEAPPGSPEPDPDADEQLDDKTDRELRVLVEAYGGEWRGRAAAVAYLRGQE